jgi:predicted extracellular nuclease
MKKFTWRRWLISDLLMRFFPGLAKNRYALRHSRPRRFRNHNIYADYSLLEPRVMLAASTPIHDIQGTSDTSPLAQQKITTTGIVTAVKSNGFFIQTPDDAIDNDPGTSEGIFVSTISRPPAAAVVGNLVTVSGTVIEYLPSNDLRSLKFTQISGPTVSLISSGHPLPLAITISASDLDPDGGIDQLEKFEGMRVNIDSLTVVQPTGGSTIENTQTVISTGSFLGVITGTDRPFREPGISVYDYATANAPINTPEFDVNPELITVDTDILTGTSAVNVSAGAVITNLTGVLDYTSRFYTIDAESIPAENISNNSPSVSPVRVTTSSEITVASAHLWRLYDAVNDPTTSDVLVTSSAYNNRLQKISMAIHDVLGNPDVLAVQSVENLSALQALANKINADTVANGEPDPQYAAYLIPGNDTFGLNIGFLVKSSTVTVNSVTQIGKTATYLNPSHSQVVTFDNPPLVLNITATRDGNTSTFNIVNNLLEAPSNIGNATTGAGVRAQRQAQAEFLANYLEVEQTNNPDVKIIVTGGFIASEAMDGYVDTLATILGTPTPADQVMNASPDLVTDDLTNLTLSVPADERYSFIINGNAQALDHIFVSSNLLPQISQTDFVHLNSDIRKVEYSNFSNPYHYSEYDPVITFIDLSAINSPPTDIALSSNSLKQSAGENAIIGKLSATDPDQDETFTFSLESGVDDNDLFNINGTDLRAIDSSIISPGNHIVTITVTDSESHTFQKQFTIQVTEASSFIVTTLNDVVDNMDGLTSLREAINLANTQSPPGTVSSSNTITFGDGSAITGGTNFTDDVADTITLNGTELSITGAMIITGPTTATLTLDANQLSRIMNIASGANVTLTGMTMMNGQSSQGGGIYNQGSLIINSMTFTKNNGSYGGAIHNGAMLTVNSTTFSDNDASYGGGIYNSGGTLTVNSSSFADNSASYGGGIQNSGTLTLNSSSFIGNEASFGGGIYDGDTLRVNESHFSNNSAGYGGGIYIEIYGEALIKNSTISNNVAGRGAGIFNQNQLTIINTTLSGNSAEASGGAIYNGKSLIAINSTIAYNLSEESNRGGGIFTSDMQTSSTQLINTIVAGNKNGNAVNDIYGGNVSSSSSHNLIGDAASSGGLTNGVNGNIVGASLTDIFANGLLADNGGPTLTIALKLGSLAENAGDSSLAVDEMDDPLTTDQRGTGFDRVVHAIDIGAYEIQIQMPTDITLDVSALDENAGVNAVIGNLSATDHDVDETFTFTLLEDMDDNSFFNINGTQLRANDSFNFEAGATYTVTVRVTDSAELTYDKQLTITINDVNETPTDIALDNQTLAENAGINAVIGNLSSTDPDGSDSFTFTLPGDLDDNSLFNINDKQLRVNDDFDFEAGTSYIVTVRVTDAVENTFDKQFTIIISDENDPIVTELSNMTVAENQPLGAPVGTFFTADQDDTQNLITYTYALSKSQDNSFFKIVDNQLVTNAIFNFETKSVYQIEVIVTTSDSQTPQTQLFEITIDDLAENLGNQSPRNISISNAVIAENNAANALVGTLTTTDRDSTGPFAYELVTGRGATDNQCFTIVDNQLFINESANFELKNSYSIRVKTTDSDGLSIEKTLTIRVSNVNEAPQNINLIKNTIAENSRIGSTVGSFFTTDPDARDKFTYTLIAGEGDADNSSFAIVRGNLQSREVFDFETKSDYTIRVQVTDQQGLSFEKVFTINVLDQREKPTAIALSNNVIVVRQARETVVGTLSAFDQDANSSFEFSLVGGAGSKGNKQFKIIGNQLVTKNVIRASAGEHYSIRVRVKDNTGLKYIQVFTIHIENSLDVT